MSKLDIKFTRLTPFKRCVLQNFPFIEADFDALTNYGLLCKIVEYLNNVISSQNEVQGVTEDIVNAFNKLYDYVHDYFKNLDVQDEINNKLDEMVEDGTLQEIITTYIQANVAWTFDSVSDMQSATNLIDGSYAQTYGFYNINDGGGALYLIREAEENETANGITTFAVDTLIAELVTYGEYVNMKQLGMSASIADNASILQYAVTNYPKSTVLFIPEDGNYVFSTSIDLGNKAITIKGTSAPDYNKASNTALVFASSDGFTNARNVTFKDLCIKGNTTTPANRAIIGGACLENCVLCYFGTALNCNYQGPSIITNCNFHNNSGNAIINPVDSRITNCTINSNGGNGINLQAGANDNIISNNKIEWNDGYGITCYNANHLVITDNIFDRNGKSGLFIGGNQTRTSVFTGNILRRNGASSSSYDASNIQINGAYDANVISENITLTGNSQDDGSGTIVPNHAIYIRDTNANKVYLTDNVLTGGTNTNPIGKNNASNVVIIDQNHPIYDNLAIKKQQLSLASNSTANFVVDIDGLPEGYSVGKSRKIVVNYRTTSDGTYGSKIINVYAYKQYNVYHLDLDNTTITDTVTASGSYSAEDGFVITFTSTSTSDFQLLCTEYTC